MKFLNFFNNFFTDLIKSREEWLNKTNNIPNTAPIFNKK